MPHTFQIPFFGVSGRSDRVLALEVLGRRFLLHVLLKFVDLGLFEEPRSGFPTVVESCTRWSLCSLPPHISLASVRRAYIQSFIIPVRVRLVA